MKQIHIFPKGNLCKYECKFMILFSALISITLLAHLTCSMKAIYHCIQYTDPEKNVYSNVWTEYTCMLLPYIGVYQMQLLIFDSNVYNLLWYLDYLLCTIDDRGSDFMTRNIFTKTGDKKTNSIKNQSVTIIVKLKNATKYQFLICCHFFTT